MRIASLSGGAMLKMPLVAAAARFEVIRAMGDRSIESCFMDTAFTYMLYHLRAGY